MNESLSWMQAPPIRPHAWHIQKRKEKIRRYMKFVLGLSGFALLVMGGMALAANFNLWRDLWAL